MMAASSASTVTTVEPDSVESVSVESDSDDSDNVEVKSLLSVLRCPKAAEISRKRKVRANPPRGKKRSCSRSLCDPKSITPVQRVKEHPSEALSISNGKLFCVACREELSLKANVVKNHLKSDKHKKGKRKLESKDARERDIVTALQKHNQTSHLEGETLPIEQQVYRVSVLTAFLKAGIPLNKLSCFRQLKERNGPRLTDRSHLANLIPFVLEDEQTRLKQEIDQKCVSVIFDGTTRLGKILVIVLRFIDSDWSIQQRLVRVQTLAKSMRGEELARELIETLSVRLSISSTRLLAAMRDRASVNGVALRTLKIVYPNLVDIGCFSHTVNLAGERFKIPLLGEFINAWNSLFAHSAKARLCWREQCGRSMPSYSQTRWWSKWEVMKAVMELFGDIEPFVSTHDDFSPATRQKLLTILSDPAKNACLRIELAAVVDAGECLVKTTYKLEGDGPLALQAYEFVNTVLASIQSAHFPNVSAVARQLCPGNAVAQRPWGDYALECVQPGFDYIVHIFGTTLKDAVAAFKAARLFSPHKVQEIQPSASSVDSLTVFPFFDELKLSDLKAELPACLARQTPTECQPQFLLLQDPQEMQYLLVGTLQYAAG